MSATSHLRQAFRYPTVEDDANEPVEIDEEHQERLIKAFHQKDIANTNFYRKIYTAIPIFNAIIFVHQCLLANTARERLFAVLSATSLLCTVYILLYMPIKPEGKGKKPIYQVVAEKGLLETYLIYFHAALAVLLQLAAVINWWNNPQANVIRDSLPFFTFGLAMYARQQLTLVDLSELQKARYEFKGP